MGVTLYYDGCWWDNKRKRRVSASFHILDEVVLPDEDDPGIVSSFTWGKKFFKSCRDGNLKRLDLDDVLRGQKRPQQAALPVPRQAVLPRPEWDFDLPELAFERIGMSRNYAAVEDQAKAATEPSRSWRRSASSSR